jgi:hypothetical protein
MTKAQMARIDRSCRSCKSVVLLGITFELTGHRRQDALARAEKMYRVPQPGPRWPAVAGPVERGVRPHIAHAQYGVPSLCVKTQVPLTDCA